MPMIRSDRSWLHHLRRARWVSPLLLVLAWEAASRFGLIPQRTLAAPSQVFGTLYAMIASGELPGNLLVSLGRATCGLAIGVVAGIVFALVAGLTREGEAAVDSPVQMLRSLPASDALDGVAGLVQYADGWLDHAGQANPPISVVRLPPALSESGYSEFAQKRTFRSRPNSAVAPT
jgi:hypothetical protein